MVSSVELGAVASEKGSSLVDIVVREPDFVCGVSVANDLVPGVSSISVGQASQSRIVRGIKRAADIIVSLSLLVLLFPFLLLIAAMIRLESRGPALFVQQRLGLGARPFGIIKFRTMRVLENGNEVVQCRPKDERVTPLGSFLRRTSLDELPQLWNVIAGHMSLVGPRPHPVNLDLRFAQQIPDYYRRCSIRPGITGLAQIRGHRGPVRSEVQLKERVQSDLEYIERLSLLLDLKILLTTIPFVIMDWKLHNK